MSANTKELYKDYWVGVEGERSKRQYYDRLYAKIMPKIHVPAGARVLDVAGGNGQFMKYLGLQGVDLLDISESGLEAARASGFRPVLGDVEKRFPMPEETYDTAFCFEVLEHLYRPNKTLAEIHNVLKTGGVLYVGQPNMRADGVHHVRRYYPKDILSDLEKTGFHVEWVDYVPAYSMRDSILDDIRRNPSWKRKLIQCVNLGLSSLPWGLRYRLAHGLPSRFALLCVVKAVKK